MRRATQRVCRCHGVSGSCAAKVIPPYQGAGVLAPAEEFPCGWRRPAGRLHGGGEGGGGGREEAEGGGGGEGGEEGAGVERGVTRVLWGHPGQEVLPPGCRLAGGEKHN